MDEPPLMDNNIRQIGELAGLSRAEQSAIKLYLIETDKQLNVTKSKFEHDFGRKVSPQAIKTILTKYESEIDQEIRNRRANPDLQRLFHLTERLKIWDEIIGDSLKPDAVSVNQRLSSTDWAIDKKKDLKTAAFALKGAAEDVHKHNRLELDRSRSLLTSDGGSSDKEDDDDNGPMVSWA